MIGKTSHDSSGYLLLVFKNSIYACGHCLIYTRYSWYGVILEWCGYIIYGFKALNCSRKLGDMVLLSFRYNKAIANGKLFIQYL